MSHYLIVYLGGNPPATPEQGQQHFAKYMKWIAALGDAAISPANPLKETHTVHPDGSVSEGGAMAMSGYTIIDADSMKSALTLAKDCPFLEIGGMLEVSEMVEMSMPK
jgi:hypothetical protein